jgi:hypothetical protein
MNCWRIRIYFIKSRFSLNGGLFVYMELLSGHEKIITKSGISLNAGTLNWVFIVFTNTLSSCSEYFIVAFSVMSLIVYIQEQQAADVFHYIVCVHVFVALVHCTRNW